MIDKKKAYAKIGCCVLILSTLFIIYAIWYSFQDMRKTAWNEAKGAISENADVFANNFDDLMDGRIEVLELLAETLEDVDFSNMIEVEGALKKQNLLLDDIALVHINGRKIYGKVICNNLSVEDAFKQALQGASVVSDFPHQNIYGKREIHIYTPVIKGEKVCGVLIGAIYSETLSSFFNGIKLDKNEDFVIINNRGKLLSQSRNADKDSGKIGDDFYEFIRNCDLYDPDSDKLVTSNSFQRELKKRESVVIKYTKEEKEYLAACVPLKKNEWYLFASVSANDTTTISHVISKQSEYLLKGFVMAIVFVFIGMFGLIWKDTLNAKLLYRFHVIGEQEDSMYFEYLFSPKRIEVWGHFCKQMEPLKRPLIGESVYDFYDYVHKDDASIRGRLHEYFDSEREDVFSAEIRLRGMNGQYGWYRLTGKRVKDKNGENKTFIGKLRNVDRQISQEKNLKERAENDMLTGVLNKKTMEQKVTELISNQKENRYYIFYIIDLDNFKNVNDTLGHIYGDQAIVDTANLMSEIFKNSGIVGRLGGDEFAVCNVFDAFDEESLYQYVKKRADEVCAANRRKYTDGIHKVEISSSVGIAIAPVHATNFEMIYKRADAALYESKKAGKDCYTIYKNR